MRRADKTMAGLVALGIVAYIVMAAVVIYIGLKMFEAADEGDTAHVVAYGAVLVILFLPRSGSSKS